MFRRVPRHATGTRWPGPVLNRQALHSRGENGSVRMDSLLVIQRAFTKVEYFSYGAG